MNSGQDLGDRFVVERRGSSWQVTDLSTDQQKGPAYLQHTDAQAAADRLNGPRRTPRSEQGDLFAQQPQEA